MRIDNKNILLISPEPWEHLFVSKHHYAVELTKRGNAVYFLNPPGNKIQISKSQYPNLYLIDYKGFIKGLYLMPKWVRKFETMRIFRKLQQVARVKFGIIWSFDNSVFYDFDSLPNRLFKISHSMDLSQSFQMARSSRSADVCFGVTPEIVERQRKRNKHSYLITHGVTLHLPIEKIILPGTNKKKVLYFGNLAMPHLNWDLLKKATERFLAVDFILVGSNHAFAHKIHTRNLHLVNSVSSKCLPGYMAACDVLILFYKKQYHNSYAMPHKMLEYLSSGKPIVSNEFSGYKEMTDLIYQADTQVEWIQNLERALDKDDPRKSEQRKSFALANTYKTKLHEIQQIIQEL